MRKLDQGSEQRTPQEVNATPLELANFLTGGQDGEPNAKSSDFFEVAEMRFRHASRQPNADYTR